MTLKEPNNAPIEFRCPIPVTDGLTDVEVFRTNVYEEGTAKLLIEYLQSRLPLHRINFDLQDGDRILRVAGPTLSVESITTLMAGRGFMCEVLN